MQLAPLAWTQYHQLVELSVDAFHANETLVAELAVMWRFVGVVGACLSPGAGGRLAAAEAVRIAGAAAMRGPRPSHRPTAGTARSTSLSGGVAATRRAQQSFVGAMV